MQLVFDILGRQLAFFSDSFSSVIHFHFSLFLALCLADLLLDLKALTCLKNLYFQFAN